MRVCNAWCGEGVDIQIVRVVPYREVIRIVPVRPKIRDESVRETVRNIIYIDNSDTPKSTNC